eukprot:jgi/Chrzof1/332/Cz01g11210.t1
MGTSLITTEPGWTQQTDKAAAVAIYHDLIMRLKRILLTYMKMRADSLNDIRWDQRRLPKDIREKLSPAEVDFYQEYDRNLKTFMGHTEDGINMDLTLDLYPPKDSQVKVRVMKDHGSLSLSQSAKVELVKGSVHNVQCSEAEHLIRLGVLQVLDPNC